MSDNEGINTSNHAKYVEARSNPVVRALMDRLFREVGRAVEAVAPTSLLDAGCGEGHAIAQLGALIPARYAGVDCNPACVAYCQATYPERAFSVASVLDLPFEDRSFDLVLCMEVLEHLERPADAVRALARVARRGLVLTVPFEPWFQIGNALRGKYRATFGNHPEHLQHWGIRSFSSFLLETGALSDVSVRTAGTWLVARARPAPDG